MVILTMKDIVSYDESLEIILVIGDDDAVSVLLHVEEVVNDLNIGF